MKRLLTFLICAALMFVAMKANAATRTWASATSGNYTNASMWGGILPLEIDEVAFAPDGAYTVTVDSNVTNTKANFTATLATTTVDIATGKVWLCTGDPSTIADGGSHTVNLVNDGTWEFDMLAVGGNDGAVGVLNIHDGANLLMTGGEVRCGRDGTGTINIYSGATVNVRHMVVNRGGWTGDGIGFLNMYGGSMTCDALKLSLGSNTNEPADIGNGIANLYGGTVTVNGDVRVSEQAPATLNIRGSDLTATGGGGIRLNDYTHIDVGGKVAIIGPDSSIDTQYYFTGANGVAETAFYFSEGGVATIHCRNVIDLRGTNDLFIVSPYGYMDTIPNDLSNHQLITWANASPNSDFDITHQGLFNVTKQSTQYVAAVNGAHQVTGSTISKGKRHSLTPANLGWFNFSTNGIEGATYDVNLRLVTNGMTNALSGLYTEMADAGHTVTNMSKAGEDWVTVTYETPDWANPRFGFDFGQFDTNLLVDSVSIGVIAGSGTTIIIR